ncbi:hypothetical protein B7494_g3606 [Chlorociboria aeruginascens]|nr:hypothetical protein B7494_g3606 [Chlorociboria aeruginascens]
MRIGIREQLALLVLITALVPLAVLAIATWFNNYNFVRDIKSEGLSLTASLKAAEVAADLLLIQATCSTILTRVLVQEALKTFYQGNTTSENWNSAADDIRDALAASGLAALLQVAVFSRNQTGNPSGLLNVTAGANGIILQGNYANGSQVMLGDPGLGYPAALYPNITYTTLSTPDPADASINATEAIAFTDFPLNDTAALLLGPLQVNNSYAMVSLTLPIVDNTNKNFTLGFMTVVAAATSLIDVMTSREGLGNTGIVLLAGPNRRENQFRYVDRPSSENYSQPASELGMASVKYIFSPVPLPGQSDRHSKYNQNLSNFGSSNFTEDKYPAIAKGFGRRNPAVNNASALLTTTNEQGASVAVGWARPQSSLADWILIVEQAHSEAWEPITRLRTLILACVFGTIGLVLLVVLPIAHVSVRPIRRLRDATKKTITPVGYSDSGSVRSGRPYDEPSGDEEAADRASQRSKSSGLMVRLRNLTRDETRNDRRGNGRGRRDFKIPGKVQDRSHFITDELTELTSTFNAMSTELERQYTRLEEKVAERTQELEISKMAAEAANESKTLFIANISHELKTPLNGILGMCAVCMGEDDLARIKRSLQVVYKSGDLLLNLLNDLLTFSKNQIGQQLSLEEKEFRLSDIKDQVKNIFRKQASDSKINFGVHFISTDLDGDSEQKSPESTLPALGPLGIGRLKDLCLWGDQHRILQVIINLVSNSLKFTPEGGKVEVRIKCIGEVEASSEGSRNSMARYSTGKNSTSRNSVGSSQRGSRKRHRNGSGSNNSQSSRVASSSGPKGGTALVINPMDPKVIPRMQPREGSPAPPPAGAKVFSFQFEVEDTGPGIPEHLQQKVFEPFVQGDLGLSKKYGGTGLGLSICSQLAGLMGGVITLSSTEGAGSTFNMQIPLKFVKTRVPSTSSSDAFISRPNSIQLSHDERIAVARITEQSANNSSASYEKDDQPRLVGLSQPFFAPTTQAPSAGKDPQERIATLGQVAKTGAKIRVLVAEDNEINRKVVLGMLNLEEIYDVRIAKDGQEAYEMVKESMDKGQLFNLIFMDIQMPNIDGLQSTRMIRKMGYSAPIVALTAFSEASNVKDCYDSGMDMFLSKPIRRPALKQVLKKFATIPEEPELSPSKSPSPAQITPLPQEQPSSKPTKQDTEPTINRAS